MVKKDSDSWHIICYLSFVINIKFEFKEMSNFEERLAKLESKNEIFHRQNQALLKENAELREKLGLNSRNSSILTSKEKYS